MYSGIRTIWCGDRHWDNYDWIEETMAKMKEHLGEFFVIEGEADGADKASKYLAQLHDLPFQGFKADWTKYGKAAGPIRNAEMLKQHPHGVLAFHLDLRKSKGTANMVDIAFKAGIPVWICTDGPIKLQKFIDELKKMQNAIKGVSV